MKLDKLTEATMLALRGKLNESFNSKLDINAIAKFLKNAIKELTTTDYTCTWYDLDKDLAIFVGWTEGYDPEDTDYIHAENDPTFVLAAKIASTHEYMKTDLDWLVQPYYEDGEVWDTEITLNNNSNFTEDADWFIKSYKGIREALDRGELLLENKKVEARSHKEDNEKAAPRGELRKAPRYIKNSPYNEPDVPKRAIIGNGKPNDKGEVWGVVDKDEIDTYEHSTPDIERYKEYKADAEKERDNARYYNALAKQSDDFASDIVRDKKLARAQRMLKGKEVFKAETKKVTEATTDVNKVVDKYKRAYHKDLDLKTVPCVIARDKMLSGWGGAEGKTHYQVVLCADSNEAYNIAHNMQSKAKQEQLANVRVSYGVKLPSRASVAYCVGRDASAWNMGDSWYERYDTEKKTESNKLPNTKNLVNLEHQLTDLIANTDDTEVLDILQGMERQLSKYLLDKHITF